jgi:lysozyme
MRSSIVTTIFASALAVSLGACVSPVTDSEDTSSVAEALTVCASGATVSGVDVSTYQGVVNWSLVKGAGKSFAIARTSDGLSFPDNRFAANWPGMKNAGLVRGAYQFFRPSQNATSQADMMVNAIQAAGGLLAGDLPPVIDVETTDNLAASVVVSQVQTWLNRVQVLTGRTPMIYTAASMQGTLGSAFSSYPLWVANFGVSCPLLPSGWTQWKMHQNSSTGSVAGIPTAVDTDVFNGSLAALQAFAAGGGGGAWSCADSAYNGAQYWTCGSGNLHECQGGVPVATTCQRGCYPRSAGSNDLCISSAPSWSCSASAYNGSQYWTCSGGSLSRCTGGTPETVACPSGCNVQALGTNDTCK